MRLWPSQPLHAITAGTVISIALVIWLMEGLGTLDSVWPTQAFAAAVAAWVVVALALTALAAHSPRRQWSAPSIRLDFSIPSLVSILAAAVLVVLLVAVGLTSALRPRPQFDVLSGHLPVAVQWLQAGSLRFMPYVSPLSLPAHYPGNSELLALWLMLPFHKDFLVQLASLPGVLLVILGTALTARNLGARPVTAAAAAVLVVTGPRYLDVLVGTNMQDMLAAGGLACAAAFIAADRRQPSRQGLVLAGLSLGLAVGARYAALVVAVPLSLVLVVHIMRRGWRQGTVMLALTAAAATTTSAYWYIRNLAFTGDPVYPQPLPWHPVHATENLVVPLFRSYVSVGWSPHDWMAAAQEALRLDGPLLFLLYSAAIVGPLVLVARRNRQVGDWLWVLLPAAEFIVFVATPASAGFMSQGHLIPELQGDNLRYLFPGLPLCAAVLAWLSSALPPRVEAVLIAAFMVVAAVASATLRTDSISTTSMAAAAVLVLVGGLTVVRAPSARATVVAGLVACIASLGLSPALARHYDAARVADSVPFESLSQRLDPTEKSIAVAGFCEIYALYGPGLDRRVEYLTGADDQLDRPIAASYEKWLDSLRTHHVQALVLGSDACFFDVPVPQFEWARQHPGQFVRQPNVSGGEIYVVNLNGG